MRQTALAVHDGDFRINGTPTYAGRGWQGRRIEGLLFNSRMVQGLFDDLNPETRARWDYPDGPGDPERNTRDFFAAMPGGGAHGAWPAFILTGCRLCSGSSRETPDPGPRTH